jgi:ABC-type multidrug transport system fused ATPase/permease subunit
MEIVAVGGGIMFMIFTFSFGLASERLVYTVRMKLFDKLLRMPLSYFDRK